MSKFKKLQKVYIIRKYLFKKTKYILTNIIDYYGVDNTYYVNYPSDVNMSPIWYPVVKEKNLISLKDYRKLKLEKISGKIFKKFFPKKIFNINFLTKNMKKNSKKNFSICIL